jgi:16S rRNA processing protein RimM
MLLVVGQVFRPHGIRGEVTVDLRTDEPDERFAVGSVLVTDSTAVRRLVPVPGGAEPPGPRPNKASASSGVSAAWQVPPTLTVESARPHQGKLLVVFEGIYDRNLADELRGVLLCVDSADVPLSTDPDEFNDHQLVGLAAVGTDGGVLGEVVRIDHAPAADLLVLRLPDGRSALVPFVKAIVAEVDIDGGRVVLTPPGGLLDL